MEAMEPIPFEIAGLPQPEALSGDWDLQPISVNLGELNDGPFLGLPAGEARQSPPAETDGLLCVYPGLRTVAYLFASTLHVRQKDPVPAMVVTTHSADGICAIFGFARDPGNRDNPQLIVNVMPAGFLPKALKPHGDSSVIDLAGIDDRIEIRQSFGFNNFGLISRLSPVQTQQPSSPDRTITDIFDDPDSIADVCAFYMSRTLTFRKDPPQAQPEVPATGFGAGDPVWRLLWRPARASAIAGFAAVFILSRLSISYRRAHGGSTFSLDFNRGANPGDPRGGNAQ